MADFIWPIVSIGNIALIILIGVLVLWKMLKEKKSGFPLADERTQKLNGKAAYYAMFMCQLERGVVVSFLYEEYGFSSHTDLFCEFFLC